MATSGTYAFLLGVEEMIVEAVERCGKDAQNLTGYVAESAVRSMNLLFAEWETQDVRYWTTEEETQTLTEGDAEYDLGSSTLGIISAVLRRDGVDHPMTPVALTTYHAKPDKTTEGKSIEYFFDRQISPVVTLWPVPENSTDVFRYWRLRQFQDVTGLNEDPDIPKRWTEAVCAGLAAKFSLKIAPDRFDRLNALADAAFLRARGQEGEKAGITIRPRGIVRRRR